MQNDLTKPPKSIFQRWWFWGIIIIIIAGVVGVFFLLTGPGHKEKASDKSEEEITIRKCIEEAIGQERARAIRERTVQATADEQRKIDDCNKNQGFSSDDKPVKPAQKITIILPFDINNPPANINPMGETVEHPDPPNPGGHPGIDFIFNEKTVPILAMADGEVKRAESDGREFIVCINSSGYAYCFGHLQSIDSAIKVGAQVKQGQKVGIGSNVHTDFGYARTRGDWVPERLCPLTYLTPAHRAILESIPIMDKMKAAGFTEVCNGQYKGKDE